MSEEHLLKSRPCRCSGSVVMCPVRIALLVAVVIALLPSGLAAAEDKGGAAPTGGTARAGQSGTAAKTKADNSVDIWRRNLINYRRQLEESARASKDKCERDLLLRNSACCTRQLGDDKAAMVVIERILKDNPHHQASLITKAEILIGQEKFPVNKVAIENTLKAMRDEDCDPRELEFKYLNLCMVYRETGRMPLALDAAKKAYAANNNAEVQAYIGDIYTHYGQFHKALVCFKMRTAADPNSVPGLCQLSDCYARLGHMDLAMKFVNRAIAIDPRSVQAHRLRGALACAAGDMDQAAREEEILRSLPSARKMSIDDLRASGFKYCQDVSMYLSKATSGWEFSDQRELSLLSARLRKERDQSRRFMLLNKRANLFLLMKEFERAEEDCDAMLRMRPDSYPAHALKAAALLGLKKDEQARAERELTVTLYKKYAASASKPQRQ